MNWRHFSINSKHFHITKKLVVYIRIHIFMCAPMLMAVGIVLTHAIAMPFNLCVFVPIFIILFSALEWLEGNKETKTKKRKRRPKCVLVLMRLEFEWMEYTEIMIFRFSLPKLSKFVSRNLHAAKNQIITLRPYIQPSAWLLWSLWDWKMNMQTGISIWI